MDPRLLSVFEQELRYFRESSVEFSRQFPKIAGRLGIDSTEIADPYVERLIEATAFLSARVNLKLNAEYPHFTQSFLEIAYPNYLAPTPSMMVIQITPDLLDAELAKGTVIPRGSAIRALQPAGQSTYCEFMTAHKVTLLPLEITNAEFFRYAPDLPLAQHPRARDIQGGVKIQLKSTADLVFSNLDVNELVFHLSGSEDVAWQLHECFLGDPITVLLRGLDANGLPLGETFELPASAVKAVGFEEDEALLPQANAGFSGHRLLHEYFSFAQRFQFIRLQSDGLTQAIKSIPSDKLELVVVFSRGDAALEKLVTTANFQLNCTPAINLFKKHLDRVAVSDSQFEFHLIPDRTRPQDFEIYSILGVTGHGKTDKDNSGEQGFHPFYAAFHGNRFTHPAYYTTRREPRLLSAKQKVQGNRTSYIGSEVFIQLVDPQEAPYSSNLRQLSITALCSNRDLPVIMPLGSESSFEFVDGFNVKGVKVVRGPSRPSIPLFGINSNWQLIDHLSLNYLSIADAAPEKAAAHIKETLLLYSKIMEETRQSQINGLKAVTSKSVTRRLPVRGPIAFGRGLEVTLEVDEMAFFGGSVFLFGAVLSQWLKRHASTNCFIETVLKSHNKSKLERMRWRASIGQRAIL
jgi:type VI secretion system protein ImpG